MPVTNLFEKKEEDRKEYHEADSKFSSSYRSKAGETRMHSFRINNNNDLVMESNWTPNDVLQSVDSEIQMVPSDNYMRQCHSFIT